MNWVGAVNRLAEQWAAALWPVIWQSAVLATLIWLLSRALWKAPAAVRFWLWMLVPLRLIVMPLVTISLPVLPAPAPVAYTRPAPPVAIDAGTPANLPAIARSEIAEGRAVIAKPPNAVAAAAPEQRSVVRPNIWTWLLLAWAIGFAIAATRLISGYLRVRRIARDAAPLSDPDILASSEDCARRMGLRRIPRIVITDENISPLLIGFFRPVVVLPRMFAFGLPQETLAVLSHEFAHLRRRDPLTGWLLGICQSIYFFHPVVHFARWQTLREREQACDECVLAMGQPKPAMYARVLIAAAEMCRQVAWRSAPAPVMAESFDDLKRRVGLICSSRNPRARLSKPSILALSIAAAIAVPGIILTARRAIAKNGELRTVAVEVVDAKGAPVADAPVEALADYRPIASGRTDNRGRAELNVDVDSHVQWIIAAKSKLGFDYFENYRDFFHPFTAKDIPDHVSLVLDGARSIRIHAVNNAKFNVPGVRFVPWILCKKDKVWYVNLSGSALAGVVTDEAGIATFDWLPSTAASAPKEEFGVTFLAQSDDYDWPDPPNAIPYDQNDELTARVLRNGIISGKVTFADGKPAGGIRVEAEGRGETVHFCRKTAITAADGSYSMHVSGEQSYLVVIVDENWTAPNQTGIIVTEGFNRQGVDFQLSKGCLIHGKVATRQEGKPVAGALILLKYVGSPTPMRTPFDDNREVLVRQTNSDNDGLYSFRVPPGNYRLGGAHSYGTPEEWKAGNRVLDALHGAGAEKTITVADQDVVVDFPAAGDRGRQDVTASIVKANHGEPCDLATFRRPNFAGNPAVGGNSMMCAVCHRPHMPTSRPEPPH